MPPRITLYAALALLFLTGIGQAQTGSISPIRKAAIERLQQKLGTIRGTIEPSKRGILLTERMLQLQRPVHRRAQPSAVVPLTDELTTATAVSATGDMVSGAVDRMTEIADRVVATQH